MTAVELFAGAGGLALGVSFAGFSHLALFERDRDCCATIRENKERGIEPVVDWPLHEGDVCEADYSMVKVPVDLLVAGPPCQPFSIGGNHKGSTDPRNLFGEVSRAARALKPRAILIENVRGLLRPSFSDYFKYVLLELSHPEILQNDGEKWTSHLKRLESHNRAWYWEVLRYHFTFAFLNAPNYGIPQRRERVFLVGFRSDVRQGWDFPKPTHSFDSLIRSKWVTGEYWDHHRVPKRRRPPVPEKLVARLDRVRLWGDRPSDKPWRTVRDTIADLPDPNAAPTLFGALNHWVNPGARVYRKHTGSPMDEPAKTIKAGGHGVPGGENMLALPDGTVRYFTVRECARLQTFPDDFSFAGAWCRCMRQLGNAVPVDLARVIAESVRDWLVSNAPSQGAVNATYGAKRKRVTC
jgi:DNA (cytosine-5)-methyltransferase 1